MKDFIAQHPLAALAVSAILWGGVALLERRAIPTSSVWKVSMAFSAFLCVAFLVTLVANW